MQYSLKEFQRLMKDLYFEKDKKRGVHKTFFWIIEEIGELSEALRKEDQELIKDEIADIIAWICSLANLLEIDIEDALKKYSGTCPKCNQIPCECEID